MTDLQKLKAEFDRFEHEGDFPVLLSVALELGDHRDDPGALRRVLAAHRLIGDRLIGITLGDLVIDTVTGVDGVVIGRSEALERTGSIQIQPQARGGHVARPIWVSLERVRIVRTRRAVIASHVVKGGAK